MSQETMPIDSNRANEVDANNIAELAQHVGQQALEATELDIPDHINLGYN